MEEGLFGVPPLLIACLTSFFSTLLLVGVYRAKDRVAQRQRARITGDPAQMSAVPGSIDDFTRIRAIDAQLARSLRGVGVTRYQQIGDWTGTDVVRVSRALSLGDRIEAESWIEQAKILASGGETSYSKWRGGGQVDASPRGFGEHDVSHSRPPPSSPVLAPVGPARSASPPPTPPVDTERLESMDYGESRSARHRAPPPESIARPSPTVSSFEGRMLHRIPDTMRKGVREIVEVRLGAAEQAHLPDGLAGRGQIVDERLRLVETMTVELLGAADAFLIEPQSPPTQDISDQGSHVIGIVSQDFGRWVWHVTPRKAGTHELTVKAVAHYPDSRGVPTAKALPDKLFTLTVVVNYAQSSLGLLSRGGKLLIAGALTTLGGYLTKDLWGPLFSAWRMILEEWTGRL